MAIIVSQSLASAHPLDHNPNIAVGMDLPIVKSPSGWFSQTYTTAHAIRVNLINLILTNKGERPMNPRFGSDLHKVVFEQNDGTIESKVNSVIRSAVSEYLPFVVIDRVQTVSENVDIDIYKLKVLITYHVPNVVGYQDLAFLVQS